MLASRSVNLGYSKRSSINKHQIDATAELGIGNDNQKILNSQQLLQKIITALDKQEPCSVVSVGATEAFVMAQYSLFTEEEFMNHPEAIIANQGARSGFNHRGISFPNLEARDQAVEAVKQADVVGYNILVTEARRMCEKVFAIYGIKPDYIFEANLRRVIMFSQREMFEAMLSNRKLLLIGSQAPQARLRLQNDYCESLNCDIVGAVSIYEYEEIPRVKDEIGKYEFDLCLLGAGINALILAPYIAESLGKVAFDIGWGMESIVTGHIVLDQWLAYIIGLERIMLM